MEASKEVLYNNIKALCANEGISMYQLEKKTGASHNSISKCDRASISWERVAKVAIYFGVSVDFLIGNTDNPHSHLNNLQPATKVLIESAGSLQISEQTALTTVKLMEVIDGIEKNKAGNQYN